MLYIYVLGYEVDFGHMEALNLITNPGYGEKTVEIPQFPRHTHSCSHLMPQ